VTGVRDGGFPGVGVEGTDVWSRGLEDGEFLGRPAWRAGGGYTHYRKPGGASERAGSINCWSVSRPVEADCARSSSLRPTQVCSLKSSEPAFVKHISDIRPLEAGAVRPYDSISVSVCHKSAFYQNTWTDRAFGSEAAFDLSYTVL